MTFSFKSITSWSLLSLILMQFIPLNRINPPAGADIGAPDLVKNALKRGCYDCHSNETHWSGIAYIAPLSWLVSDIVTSGRKALNFSAGYKEKNSEINRIISERPAHQRLYYLWKADAQLTDSETSALLKWLNHPR